jgi:hypothetical protein
MKKALAFFTFLFPILIFGQSFVIPQPKIWLRADSIQTSDIQWRDVSGNNIPATLGDTQLFQQLAYLNYNRSLLFTDNQTISIDSLFLDSKDMTVIIVYKTDSLDEEQSLWKLTADTNSVGLTSQKINGSDISIKYKDNNKQGVIINSLTQSIEMADSVYYSSFQIGNGYDESLNGKVSEFLFFNRKLSNPEIIQHMSYLAVKYGVTLQKTDYLASDSTTIWNYTQYPDYSAFVLGIGRDDVMGLNQKQSKGIEDQIIMGLGSEYTTNEMNPNLIPDKTFMMIGLDSTGLKTAYDLEIGTGDVYVAYGKGLFQATGTNIPNYLSFMKVDARGWQGNLLDYKLFIDDIGLGTYLPQNIVLFYPDSLTADSMLCFSNIQWDLNQSGTDYFSFVNLSLKETERLTETNPQVKAIGENPAQNTNTSDNNTSDSNTSPLGNRYGLYPNPTRDNFTIWAEYTNPTKVEVTLFSSEGKKLQSWNGNGNKNYQFTGTQTIPGNYLIEFRSEKETKTFKMIVQ